MGKWSAFEPYMARCRVHHTLKCTCSIREKADLGRRVNSVIVMHTRLFNLGAQSLECDCQASRGSDWPAS